MRRVFALFAILATIFAVIWSCNALNDEVVKLVSSNQTLYIKSRFYPTFIDTQISRMTLKQKVSSLFILHTPGADVSIIQDYLQTHQPGGLIFMSDNIPSTNSELKLITEQIQSDKKFPYLLAVDQEGGVVSRLRDDNYPAAFDLKNLSPTETYDAFLARSLLLKQVGLNLNFGIVADVTNNPDSFIYSRVFGGDSDLVGQHVSAAVDSSKNLTLSTLKHFPGHGEADADSHSSIPTTNISFQQWITKDMPAFKQGILAGADVIMFGHLRYSSVDDLPATLSKKWHDILKDELDFKGITITDDMNMLQHSGEVQFSNPIQNAIDAFCAGNTMLLYVLGQDNSVSGISIDQIIDGVVDAINIGQLDIKQINTSVKQILQTRRMLLN